MKTERKCPGSQLIIVRAGLGGMMCTEACHQIRQTFVCVLVDVQSFQGVTKQLLFETVTEIKAVPLQGQESVKKTLTFKAVPVVGALKALLAKKLLILHSIQTKGYDNQVYKSGL